jgi:hypothetical protein
MPSADGAPRWFVHAVTVPESDSAFLRRLAIAVHLGSELSDPETTVRRMLRIAAIIDEAEAAWPGTQAEESWPGCGEEG